MKDTFRQAASRISAWTGTATVFLGAIIIILVWVGSGPLFHFSDTWQLVINTGTTIVTFLMVFLIQNTQNRDTKAIQLKLDELLHATKGARNHFVGLEAMSDEDLAELDREFRRLATNRASERAIDRLHDKIRFEHERRLQNKSRPGAAVLHLFSHTDTHDAAQPSTKQAPPHP